MANLDNIDFKRYTKINFRKGIMTSYPFYDCHYYNSISGYLKLHFGKKVVKLSVDGGFTCPNRDGNLSWDGCIFCSEKGSGDFSGKRCESISSQISSQVEAISRKWPDASYIVYFQNFTNTYGDIDDLRQKYEEALSYEGVMGLAIATRPDCISDEVLNLLTEINKKTFLWIELGLQTIHENTAELINRCYKLPVYDNCVKRLNQNGIKVVVHVIVGLPGESKSDIFETIRYISSQNIFGLKLQLLHILKGTALESLFSNRPEIFNFLEFNEYVNTVVDIIEILPKDITIHRITGDAPKELLIEPKWSLNKMNVINNINREFRKRKSHQGI